MLSFYLKETERYRMELIGKLEEKDNAYFKEKKYPTGLAKIPVGWQVIGDKGFTFDSIRYPNWNRIITPNLKNKRKQLSRFELNDDLPICQLRYISETHFSRITDENSLEDRVKTEYFPYLQDCEDYAEGKANLKQPFYPPNGY